MTDMAQKRYTYKKGEDSLLDQEFEQASKYGKVKIGNQAVFWKKGLGWNGVLLSDVKRAFRRIQAVDTKMCCGNVNFDTQKLVLILKDNTELELVLGDGMPKEAELMYSTLQERAPQVLFGKE